MAHRILTRESTFSFASVSTEEAPWFAIRTRARVEKSVSVSLRDQGYEEFLPLYRVRRQWGARTRDVDLPLFPGYIFARLGSQQPVTAVPGVVSVVGKGKIPEPVDASELESVRAIVKSGQPARPWPFLKVGPMARVDRGPLAGVEGILLDSRKARRLIVCVTLLRRSVSVELDLDVLSPANAASL